MTVWVQKLREAADNDAASELYGRYLGELTAALGRKVNAAVQSVNDPESASHQALAELLMALQNGRYPDLNDRESLWALLLVIGDRRVKQDWRKATAERRDVGRNAQTPVGTAPATAGEPTYNPKSTGPSPELVIELKDVLANLMKRLTGKHATDLLACHLSGYSSHETRQHIERKCGHPVSERSVRRWREIVRRELLELYPAECAP